MGNGRNIFQYPLAILKTQYDTENKLFFDILCISRFIKYTINTIYFSYGTLSITIPTKFYNPISSGDAASLKITIYSNNFRLYSI